MKRIILACITILLVSSSCHKTIETTTKIVIKEVEFGPDASERKIELNELSTDIETPTFKPEEWLTVERVTFTSGHPVIKVSVLRNNTSKERRIDVNIYAKSDEILVLKITQQPDGDLHNIQTNQPAFVRKR